MDTQDKRDTLYCKTFQKWSLHQQLSTLQKTALETSLAVNQFCNDCSEGNKLVLFEKLADFETMKESLELTFPDLREEIDKSKSLKLNALAETI